MAVRPKQMSLSKKNLREALERKPVPIDIPATEDWFNRFIELCENNKISIDEIAELIRVGRSTICYWKKDRNILRARCDMELWFRIGYREVIKAMSDLNDPEVDRKELVRLLSENINHLVLSQMGVEPADYAYDP